MDSVLKYLNPFTLGPTDLQYWFTKFHEDQDKKGLWFQLEKHAFILYTKLGTKTGIT